MRILMKEEYNGLPRSFFKVLKGSSWHSKDARLMFWMASHWVLLTVLGFCVGGVVLGTLWLGYKRWILGGKGVVPHNKGRGRSWGSWWRGTHKTDYELVDRHEV